MGELVSGSIKHSRHGQITYAHTEAANAILTCVALALEDCIVNVPNTTAPGQHPVVTKACQILSFEPLAPTISRADRKSTRLNSSHVATSYAVFRLTTNSQDQPPGR